MTNETQEIDLGALRARLAETPADLRGRIEAALRARHGAADVRAWSWCATPRTVAYRACATVGGWSIETSVHEHRTEADALAALASVVGLDADGSDPRAEVDYLDAILARQHAILTGVADALRGDPGPLASHSHHDLAERAAAMVALLAVTQASLEAASSGRRVTACDEIERLQRELAEARAALREYVPRCTDCDALATRQLDGYAGWGGLRCDACAPVASQHAVEHADALRAASVTP